MMKVSNRQIALLIIALLLSNCVPTGITATPTITDTQLPFPAPVLPTFTPTSYDTATAIMAPSFTPTPSPTQTATALLSPSLEPEQAREFIKTLLHEPVDCAAPCFWGIVPGQTTLGEAKNILNHLGLEIGGSSNKHFRYGTSFKLDSGLSMLITLTGTDEIVRSLRISINPEKQKADVTREWLAYSPEMMIQRYGSPSRVDLFLDRGAPQTSFGMDIYFDTVDTIIEYNISDIGPSTRICPLRDQFASVYLWMGNDPLYPPLTGEPLEKTTSLTMEAFSELLTGNPENTCFDLNVEMFP